MFTDAYITNSGDSDDQTRSMLTSVASDVSAGYFVCFVCRGMGCTRHKPTAFYEVFLEIA